MKVVGPYEKCRLYIEAHSKASEESSNLFQRRKPCPCITISRQVGAGADKVGQFLAEIMNKLSNDCTCEWTYFDKNLIERVIQDHHLPELVSKYMAEDKFSNIDSIVSDVLGVKTSQWNIVQKTTETILQLARMGNAIIVGRGSGVITSKLKNAFHVRLIAPIENRIKNIMERFDLTERQALEYIRREDKARRNYVKSFFYRDIEEPYHYHLIINTGLFTYHQSAKIIADAVRTKFLEVLKPVY